MICKNILKYNLSSQSGDGVKTLLLLLLCIKKTISMWLSYNISVEYSVAKMEMEMDLTLPKQNFFTVQLTQVKAMDVVMSECIM